MSNYKLEDLRNDERTLKAIVNKMLEFGDVNDSYDSVSMGTHNIYCPFHDKIEGLAQNNTSPAARHYYDEGTEIFVIHCFTAKKSYSVYDYIKYVIQEDVFDYLLSKRDKDEVFNLYENIIKGNLLVGDSLLEAKTNYVENLYFESNGLKDFIHKLYTGESEENE